MSQHSDSSREVRNLTQAEHQLTEWLLLQSGSKNHKYLAQLSDARVAGKCQCGCASVDFSITEKTPHRGAGLEILADYLWRSESGNLMGVFVFAQEEQLAGLEVWSVDGEETPTELPTTEQLIPCEEGRNA